MKTKLPEFIELYPQLIAIPTISAIESELDHANRPLIDLLADWFGTLGFRVAIQEVANSRNKFNLIATLGEGAGGLLLAGHTDTVPWDEGRWTQDPFQLTERNNRLYGLGSADMKGFFAFILDALRDLDLRKLTKPLTILATADEETTMAGARHFVQHTQLKPDCAIIGEPTSLRPVRAHKGHLAKAIRIEGQSGHSSDPDRGVNAIELMHSAISQLSELKNTLKNRYQHTDFVIPYPTMNFGHIFGGDAPNRICACCELHLDIRPLPGLALTDLQHLLMASLAPVMGRWPGRLTVKDLHEPIPGYECPSQHSIIKLIENLIGNKTEVVNYCTEAPFIQQLCPTLVLGPGSIEQAHQPDEYLSCDFIEPTQQLIQNLIQHFCH